MDAKDTKVRQALADVHAKARDVVKQVYVLEEMGFADGAVGELDELKELARLIGELDDAAGVLAHCKLPVFRDELAVDPRQMRLVE